MHLLQITVTPWREHPVDPCGKIGCGWYLGMSPDLVHAVNRHHWDTSSELPDLIVYATSASDPITPSTVVALAIPTAVHGDHVPKGRYCYEGTVVSEQHPLHAQFMGKAAPLDQFRNPIRREREYNA
ncbi:hypothetical protein [Kitasatospora sp. LaBMicrA B282]|uniref:hypothetical protein n=1 Tax=Kitasatospora sp. LaBMicrA B282 TaxID=3420949 RepID=UPI003D0C7E87